LINEEAGKYNVITVEDIQKAAQTMFRKENSSVLIYKPKKL
jgi:predicted Zn-dependent peptidase